MATKRLSGDVLKYLKDCDLEGLAPKLEALGVRGVTDLALVDDADLVRWGLSTIERRRFFGKVRKVLGTGDDLGAALLPPSALTQAPHANKAAQKKRRQDTNAVGPARLDELLGRGSAEHQVPRLAERMLAATGPIDVPDLADRLARTAPALAQGYNATEWPQFVEACCRGYGRLQVEDGVLAGDKPIVSICSTVLFAASEEVVADTACWVRVVTCLATPKQVAIITAVCRASREVADGPEVWGKLLMRWYPKATLLNPDWVAQDELEKKLEEALNNDYALAALRMRLDVDTPYDIGELMNTLPQQTTPKALVKFMSTHQEMFRQSPDGRKFCISKAEGQADLKNCKGWRTVNPFQTPSLPAAGSAGPSASSGSNSNGAPKPPPPGRPTALAKQDREDRQAASEVAKAATPVAAPDAAPAPNVCQRLDPKQAFRLYHSGLLSQRTDQSKRGKLEAWEYYTESNSKCVMAAGDLLDLAETRTNSIRMNDPAVVHELVSQTLEGVVYKVPFGFWNRRVRILTAALNASQLRVGREQRKKFERKLVEFMEWVKKERGFGYYQCEACGSRWRSGFSYEEIQQQCLGCGAWAKPYRIQDLESPAAREAREKGEPIPEAEKERSKGKGRGVTKWQQPLVEANVPTIQHQQQGRLYPYQTMKRPWLNQQGGPPPQRPRYNEDVQVRPGKAWNWNPSPKETARDPVFVTPRPKGPAGPPKWAAAPPPPKADPAKAVSARPATPKPAAAKPAVAAAPAAPVAVEPTARYEPGKGGFFARKSAAAAASSEGSAASVAGSSSAAVSSSSAPATTAASSSAVSSSTPASESSTAAPDAGSYKPGAGGFFARKKAAAEAAAKAAAEAEAAAKAAAEAKKEPAAAPKKEAATTPAVDLGLTPEEMAAMGLTVGGSSSSSSSGTAKAASAAAAEAKEAEPAAKEPETYKAGGGGFFARKRAAAAEAAAAAAAAAAAGETKASEAAETKTEPVKEDAISDGKETYKAGGGGFFARKRAAAAGAAAAAAGETKEPATKDAPSNDVAMKGAEDDMAHIPADKLMALKTLGLSLEEAARMGIIPADMVKKPAKSAEELKKQREEEKHEALDDAAKQLAERRKAQAARFAAAKAGKKEEEATSNLPKEKDVPASDAIQATCSDEVFVDAIKAVVWFLDEETGGSRVLTAQASDASFLVSDLVFWPMLRRLGAEVSALEAKASDLGCQWESAPSSAEGAIRFAEERGYTMPEGLSEPTASPVWRRALLVEVATELMMARLQEGRGFMDIPALAGPAKSAAQNGGTWEERPVEDEAGLDDVTRATKLVGDLSTAASAQAAEAADLATRLTSVADAKPVAAAGPGSRADVPALAGKWDLMQEMGIREAAATLKTEYASRRTILLHRLDVSVQAIFASKDTLPEGSRRKAADALSRMWAGWRRGAAKAQMLSEWDALAATKGMLARAVAARVSGPSQRVKSKVKHVRIGAVPDRGGIPDGYVKDKSGQKPTGSSSVAAPAAPAPQASAASQGGAPRQRTGKSAIKETPAPAASSSSSGAAASSEAGVAASSSSAGEADPASSNGEKPAAKEETVGAKPESKPKAGMRSTNKEGEKEYRAQKKKEHEQGGRISSYYEELTKARGQ